MRKDKKQALQLRSTGKSYQEIKKLLGIPKSTLSDWLRDKNWSGKIKQILKERAVLKNTVRLRYLNSVRGKNLNQLYVQAEQEAVQEFENFKFYPLFIAGLTIYWGEGDKITKHMVRVSNIDPEMIKVYIKFLREVCNLPEQKIRASLLLYPDLKDNECLNFWQGKTGLLKENFNKCIFIQGKHKTRRIQHGVCSITVNSTYLKKKIAIWLNLLPKELISKNYLRV